LVKWLSLADLLFLWLNYLPLKIFISASGISEPFNAAAVPYFLLNYKCKVLCLFSSYIFFTHRIFRFVLGQKHFSFWPWVTGLCAELGKWILLFGRQEVPQGEWLIKKKRMEKGEGLLGKWEWKWESFKCNLRLSTMQQCGRMSR